MFGIGDGGSIIKIMRRVFGALLRCKSKYLYWPDEQERKEIRQLTEHELPGCIGYLDGTEIRLSDAPSNNHETFFSRKHQYSIKMQAICDFKTRIRYATVGYSGSVHDARIFAECCLNQNPGKYLLDSDWIAADSAYKLTSFFITPYRRNARQPDLHQRVAFNKHFSSFRVRIEHCFGKLKERFQSLIEMNIQINSRENYVFLCDWVIVCCILHNIILSGDEYDDLGESQENYSSIQEDDNDIEVTEENIGGELRRQIIYEKCIQNHN